MDRNDGILVGARRLHQSRDGGIRGEFLALVEEVARQLRDRVVRHAPVRHEVRGNLERGDTLFRQRGRAAGLMLGGWEDGLLPRSYRPDQLVPKLVEKVGEAEDLNRVSICDQDAQRQAPLAYWPSGATWLEIDYSTLTRP